MPQLRETVFARGPSKLPARVERNDCCDWPVAGRDGMRESRLVSVGAVRLHVVEAGPSDGPPLLMLHGFPEFWWGWRKQIDVLAERGFRVVVPDMRGYGGSDAPIGVEAYRRSHLVADIIALADALGFERFDLVGHDWGGLVAWPLAASHAHRVRRLVILAAPHADTMTGELLRHPMQLLRSSYIAFFQLPLLAEAALRFDRFAALRHALTNSSRAETFSPSDLDRYVDAWRGAGRLTSMLNYYRALRLQEPRVGRITVPTLILWGALDTALGVHLATAAKGMCDDAELVVRHDVSHWLHLEEPEWVSDMISTFLE
jgi:pimeloyl-ACP methyl ester carboxylesterase